MTLKPAQAGALALALTTAPAFAASDAFTFNGAPIFAQAAGGYLPAMAAYFPNGLFSAANPGFVQGSISVGTVTLGAGSATIGAVTQSGSTGSDYSANSPALPNVGANFAASGPYASYVLVATVPAAPSRNSVDVENTSGNQIAIVRDDGTAASGAAPNHASVFTLAGGSAVGAQGGSYVSGTFKGRLQIYAPSSSAQLAIFVD
jgi:hypothetical protein